MKICFIDKTEFSYSFKDINSSKLRGAESVIINLSKELSEIGHDVVVFNNCGNEEYRTKNLSWINLNRIKENHLNFDVVISNGDCNFFKMISSKKNILISHSNQPLEQFVRKKQLLSYLKYKPTIWVTSEFQLEKRSIFIKMFGHLLIPWSVDKVFLNSKLKNKLDNNQAIFTSRPDRNQKILIDIWINEILPNVKNKKLLVYGNKTYLHNSIKNKSFVSQNELISDLINSRLYLIPGHKAETFCLAAEEARELCIPIVTLGIGCLSERVEHGITGFVAKDRKEFRDYSIRLFMDDKIWLSLRNNLINNRGKNSWKKVANSFLNKIK